MHVIKNTTEFAKLFYSTDEPTKNELDTVTAMCRQGRIKNAQKVCSKWFINCTREWPTLFPDEPEPAPAGVSAEQLVAAMRESPRAEVPSGGLRIDADMRLGDAVSALVGYLERQGRADAE